MKRNINGTCSPSCCSNPNIRTINTMGADTQGNFTIRGDQGIHVTVGTNEVIISGIAVYYDNTDGNIAIDNDLMTINLTDDLAVTGNVSMGGDLGVTGDAVIAGDLTVNGTYYTVHAEHVYTEDDYIILREGATTPLAAGSYAGFQVTKYDGTNDGRLVVDNAGVARVGDVGDEQPLLTRDEAADLTDEECLVWDAANSKAVTQAIPTAISTALAGKEDTLTSIQITNALTPGTNISITQTSMMKYGKIITLGVEFYTNATIPASTDIFTVSASYRPKIREWLSIINVSAGIAHSASLFTNGIVQATSNLTSSQYHMIRLTYILP